MRLTKLAGATAAASALLLLAVQAHSADDPAPAKGNCHVAGHVNGPDGKGIAGVQLKLVSKNPPKPADAPALAKKPKKAAPDGLSTTTDADGNFKLDDVPAGSYTLTASLKGYGKSVQQVNLTDGQTRDNVKMQLTRKRAG